MFSSISCLKIERFKIKALLFLICQPIPYEMLTKMVTSLTSQSSLTLDLVIFEDPEEPSSHEAKLSFTGIWKSCNHFSHGGLPSDTGQTIIIRKQEPVWHMRQRNHPLSHRKKWQIRQCNSFLKCVSMYQIHLTGSARVVCSGSSGGLTNISLSRSSR